MSRRNPASLTRHLRRRASARRRAGLRPARPASTAELPGDDGRAATRRAIPTSPDDRSEEDRDRPFVAALTAGRRASASVGGIVTDTFVVAAGAGVPVGAGRRRWAGLDREGDSVDQVAVAVDSDAARHGAEGEPRARLTRRARRTLPVAVPHAVSAIRDVRRDGVPARVARDVGDAASPIRTFMTSVAIPAPVVEASSSSSRPAP